MSDLVKRYLMALESATPQSLNKSLKNCHAEGLFSLVFAGVENGLLTRAFIAQKEIKPMQISLHSHCYPLYLTAITDGVSHHDATESVTSNLTIEKRAYKSPINGGVGLSKKSEIARLILSGYAMPPKSRIYLSENCIHTVSCAKDSIWIVEEKGVACKESAVYGRFFNTDSLYGKATNQEVQSSVFTLKKALKKLLKNQK